jgi:hypothetical protein
MRRKTDTACLTRRLAPQGSYRCRSLRMGSWNPECRTAVTGRAQRQLRHPEDVVLVDDAVGEGSADHGSPAAGADGDLAHTGAGCRARGSLGSESARGHERGLPAASPPCSRPSDPSPVDLCGVEVSRHRQANAALYLPSSYDFSITSPPRPTWTDAPPKARPKAGIIRRLKRLLAREIRAHLRLPTARARRPPTGCLSEHL